MKAVRHRSGPLVWVLCGLCSACDSGAPKFDETQARQLIQAAGCGSCHRIGGMKSAQGEVGPPLQGFKKRGYIAGILPNEFENLVAWLVDPQAFAPKTAMPATGLNQKQAELVARYLYAY